MKINKCLICKNNRLTEFTNLKNHPLADTFVNSRDIQNIPSERLICNFCKNCNHMQLKYKIDAKKRYNFVDYSYTSSNSKVSQNYLDNYYIFLDKQKKIILNVAEIGANDGYLISQFPKKIKKVCFEPSNHMDKILKKKKIFNIKKFFEEIKIKNLSKFKNYFDIIIANNVLNHSDNPNYFFKNLNYILNEKGFAAIEIPYAPWMIKNNKFDLIYHEHISYFSLKSIKKLSKKNNLFIKKIIFPNYHGKMLRVILSKQNTHYRIANKFILYEKKLIKYKNIFNNFINMLKIKFNKKINIIKKNKNNLIVGIGASTKANTFLNFLELDYNKIDFMTDASKFKINKFTPKSFIKIKNDNFLKKIFNKKIYVFFPTWNINTYLKKKIKSLNKNIRIIDV